MVLYAVLDLIESLSGNTPSSSFYVKEDSVIVCINGALQGQTEEVGAKLKKELAGQKIVFVSYGDEKLSPEEVELIVSQGIGIIFIKEGFNCN